MPTRPTPPRQNKHGSYRASRGLEDIHEGHIGRRQHFVMYSGSFVVLEGGRELEQARQRVVVRSIVLPRCILLDERFAFLSNPNVHIPRVT